MSYSAKNTMMALADGEPDPNAPKKDLYFDEKSAAELVRDQLMSKLQLTWDEAEEFARDIVSDLKGKVIPKEQRVTMLSKRLDPIFAFFNRMAKKHSGFLFISTCVVALWVGLVTTWVQVGNWPWYIITGMWLSVVFIAVCTCAYIVDQSET